MCGRGCNRADSDSQICQWGPGDHTEMVDSDDVFAFANGTMTPEKSEQYLQARSRFAEDFGEELRHRMREAS